MKRFLSIDGWCPAKLKKGQTVLFKHKNKLYIGRVGKGYNVDEERESFEKDPNNKHETWYIESLDGTHKYYPYASDVCLIDTNGVNVHELYAQIVEK